jgi:hypothetical protein
MTDDSSRVQEALKAILELSNDDLSRFLGWLTVEDPELILRVLPKFKTRKETRP